MNVNSIVIVGRLAKEPEMRYSTAGKASCKMTVAVDKPWHKDGEPSADFFEVRTFGKQAETSAQNLVKGQEVGIQGRMESRTYEAQDGTRKKVWELVGLHVDFGSKPRNQGQSQAQHQESGGGDGDDWPEEDPY